MAASCDAASHPARLGFGVDVLVLRPPAAPAASTGCGLTAPSRSSVWFLTRTRMSRVISVRPLGVACRYSGAMYRSQRSGGSMTWRSLSAIT